MRNLFYHLYNGVVYQGRIKYIYAHSSTYSTDHIFSGVVAGKGYSLLNYRYSGELAGLEDGGVYSEDIVYLTFDDCKKGINGISFKDFTYNYLHTIFDNGIKIGKCPYGIIPEVEVIKHKEDVRYVISLPYWTWDGVKAMKKYASGFQYDFLSGNFIIKREIDEKVYLTEEECIADNVIKLVCFPDEEI